MNGKTFNVNDEISDDELSCRAACRCVKHDEEAAKIICANVECPENFGGRRNPDCVNKYDNLKQCCRSGEICGMTTFYFILVLFSKNSFFYLIQIKKRKKRKKNS